MQIQTEIVTTRQWDSYAVRIMNANLKQSGRSPDCAAISRRAYDYIVEIYNGEGTMRVKKGWRERMKDPNALPAGVKLIPINPEM